jgi:hypothetical protein
MALGQALAVWAILVLAAKGVVAVEEYGLFRWV